MPNFIDPIVEVFAREVLDSRGNPTVEALFHPEPLLVNGKLWNCVMGIKIVI